jgi:ubiquinone/menaquinone biosynthesis C-methylase UbiE
MQPTTRPPAQRTAAVAPHPSASDLVRYSVHLGLRGMSLGGGPEARWRVWMPLDVDRVVELPWAAARVMDARPERVLDIASPKLLACWLGEHVDAEIVATDLWEDEISRWKTLVAAVDAAGHRFPDLAFEAADATQLAYPDASFDTAVSVSVIEHIPGDGDIAALRELTRVLRPGGSLVLTFPYGERAEDVSVEHDLYGQRYDGTPLFFYRRYAAETVGSRLLDGGGLEIVDRTYWHKSGVRSAQAGLHRLIPARWEVGRALGPVLPLIGRRAMTSGSPDDPGTEGVLGLVLRRATN